MYNRYIPQSDGSFQRRQIPDPPKPRPAPPKMPEEPLPQPESQAEESQTASRHQSTPRNAPVCRREQRADSFLRQLLPKDMDTGDLLVVILLLLMAEDRGDDRGTAMLTLALYFMM